MLDSVRPWVERFKARLQSMEHINRRSARIRVLAGLHDRRPRQDRWYATSATDQLISCAIWKERNSRDFCQFALVARGEVRVQREDWIATGYTVRSSAATRHMLVRFVQRKDTLHFLVFWWKQSIPVWIVHVQDEPIWKQIYISFWSFFPIWHFLDSSG